MNEVPEERTKIRLTEDEEVAIPILEWNFKFNDQTKKEELDLVQLSDGSKFNTENLRKALKKAAGTEDINTGERILRKTAKGLSSETFNHRINEVSSMLPALEPKNPTEALLLGQFLALNDSGMECLRLANLPDQRFHCVEKYFMLAQKLLNTANQTMQTILKYRSGGQQTVQVVHVHNEGQAIVAQHLSPSRREVSQEKS